MNFIPRPLVQPGPSKKEIGRKLAKVIATMRKLSANGPACAEAKEMGPSFNQ
jgi:hypothetical protein